MGLESFSYCNICPRSAAGVPMGPGTHLPFLGWLLPLVRACLRLVTPLKPCLLHALLLRLLQGLPQLTPVTSMLSGSLLNPLLSSTPSSLGKRGVSPCLFLPCLYSPGSSSSQACSFPPSHMCSHLYENLQESWETPTSLQYEVLSCLLLTCSELPPSPSN